MGYGIENYGNGCYCNASIQALRLAGALNGEIISNPKEPEDIARNKILEIADKLKFGTVNWQATTQMRQLLINCGMLADSVNTQEDANFACLKLLEIMGVARATFTDLKNQILDEELQKIRYPIMKELIVPSEVAPIQEVIKSLPVKEPPDILSINLRRYNDRYERLHDTVRFEPKIQVAVSGSDKTITYELKSVVVHQGTSINGGHYYTYAYNKGDFIEFNDSRVNKVDASDAEVDIQHNGYIYFYRKLESN